jgi:hypothetical protein
MAMASRPSLTFLSLLNINLETSLIFLLFIVKQKALNLMSCSPTTSVIGEL